MDEPMLHFCTRPLHHSGSCPHRDTLTLKLRKHTPASFPDVLALPFLFPVTNRSSRNTLGSDDDHEPATLTGVADPAVAFMAFVDLLRRLRPAEVNGHG